MGKFNLIDEPWISIIDENEIVKEVSLANLFENAHLYKDLAGDSKTQDFAVLRILLAILHTVFSRVNTDGEVYSCEGDELFSLDEKFYPQDWLLEDEDVEEYSKLLEDTVVSIWNNEKIPEVVNRYLEKWKERFYLFDNKYPFMQVVKSDITPDKLSKNSPSIISGKNINRLISESGNKIAMFSPKSDKGGNKERLSASEVARWLITFHGYTGLSDKVIFGKDKYKASKGWLFDIGGVYFKGENLLQTFMLNLYLTNSKGSNLLKPQLPCWESEPSDFLETVMDGTSAFTVSGLYTSWSRAVFIDPEIDLSKPFNCSIVKLPEIEHKNNFLEPMTIWKFNETGEFKNYLTPKKHPYNQAIWRSFGSIVDQNNSTRPGIIGWLHNLSKRIDVGFVSLCSASMRDDGNATSWVPVDEICDELYLPYFLLDGEKSNSLTEHNWDFIVNDTVEFTKKIISVGYRKFIWRLKEIRGLEKSGFVDNRIEEIFFKIDQPFRDWIRDIEIDDDRVEKKNEWKAQLKKMMIAQVNEDVTRASNKDFIGSAKTEKKKPDNIMLAYNSFMIFMGKEFK